MLKCFYYYYRLAIIQNQKAEEKPTIEIMPSTSGESKKVGRMQNRRKISRVLGSNSVVNEHKTGGGNRTGLFPRTF